MKKFVLIVLSVLLVLSLGAWQQADKNVTITYTNFSSSGGNERLCSRCTIFSMKRTRISRLISKQSAITIISLRCRPELPAERHRLF